MEKLEVLVRNVAQYDLIECEGVTQTYLKSPPCPSGIVLGFLSLTAPSGQCGERRSIPVPLVHPGNQEDTGLVLFQPNCHQPLHPSTPRRGLQTAVAGGPF